MRNSCWRVTARREQNGSYEQVKLLMHKQLDTPHAVLHAFNKTNFHIKDGFKFYLAEKVY